MRTPPISAPTSPYLSPAYTTQDVPSMADEKAQCLCGQPSDTIGGGGFQGIIDRVRELLLDVKEQTAAYIFKVLFEQFEQFSSDKLKDLKHQLLALIQEYSSKLESEAFAILALKALSKNVLPLSEKWNLQKLVVELVKAYSSKITSEEGKVQVSVSLLDSFWSVHDGEFRDQLWAVVANCSSEIKDKKLNFQIAKKLIKTLPDFHNVHWKKTAWELVKNSLTLEEVDSVLQESNSESLAVVLQFIPDENGQEKVIDLLQKVLRTEDLPDGREDCIRWDLEKVLEKLETEVLKAKVKEIIKFLNPPKYGSEISQSPCSLYYPSTMDPLPDAEQRAKELCEGLYHASGDQAFLEIIKELKDVLPHARDEETVASVLEKLLNEDIWHISDNHEHHALVFVGNHLSKINNKDFAMSLLKHLFEKFHYLGYPYKYHENSESPLGINFKQFAWTSVAEPLLNKLMDDEAASVISQKSQLFGIAEALRYMSKEKLQTAALQRLEEALHGSSNTSKNERDILLTHLKDSVEHLKTGAFKKAVEKLIEASDRPQIVQVLIYLLNMPFVPFLWVARFVQQLCQRLIAACRPQRVRVGQTPYTHSI